MNLNLPLPGMLTEDLTDWTPDQEIRGWYTLCVAMLSGAYDDLQRGPDIVPGVHLTHALEARLEAIDWIYTDAPQNLFRFANICHIMGIDEDETRAALLRFLTDDEKDVWL